MANKIAGVRSVAVFVAACEVLTVSDLILQRTRAWASENRPSDEVLAVIGTSFPAYSVIGAENIDEHSCGAVQKRPGLVVADFNGDGREDYAVLVKSEVKEAREWQGQKLKLVEVKLVALIQGAMKTLEAIVLETFDTYEPLAVLIQLYPAGEVQESAALGSKSFRLTNPGIARVHCEKSVVVFYWDKQRKRFQQVGLVD